MTRQLFEELLGELQRHRIGGAPSAIGFGGLIEASGRA